MKYRVGFYLQNRDITGADLRDPSTGNPGVGGTQFLFTALPWYLDHYHSLSVEPHIYANSPNYLPPNISAHAARDATEAVQRADQDEMDLFIFRPTGDEEGMSIYSSLRKVDLSGIAWAHNIPSSECLRALTESDAVKRFVAVGREQLDELRDHPVFNKSTYIYNGFDASTFEPSSVFTNGKRVVYIGALVPAKGFHVLARAWKDVIAEVPDAELIVIGSARVYDADAELGKWGVARENYEASCIRPYLSDDDESPMESVDFKGVLGKEKIPLMQEACVGVANPSGKSETFCLSAVEFQAAGTPVVSKAYRGLLDTVQHGKTGLLGGESDIADNVIQLLDNPEQSREMGREGISWVKSQFSFESVCQDWIQLFEDVQEGRPARNDYPLVNIKNNLKFLREGLRQFKNNIPGGGCLPSIWEIREFAKKIIR
jgi:glycosyltransferase involved in cell wall biosynthesis